MCDNNYYTTYSKHLQTKYSSSTKFYLFLLVYFSIIAFSPEVTGIDEEGFSYPLHQAALYNKESIGVSNEIVEKEATLRLQSGYLIVMRTTD